MTEPIEAAALEASLALHRRIEAFYGRIEDQRVDFGGMTRVESSLPHPPGMTPGVRTDPIVCALAVKAATTKRAIAALCELHDGDNALVLTRVLMENACVLEWLTRDRRRLDAYVMFTSVCQERMVATIERFRDRFIAAGADPELKSEEYHRAIWQHVFSCTRSDRPTWEFNKQPTTANPHTSGRKRRRRGRRDRESLGRPLSVGEIFRDVGGPNPSFEHEVLYGTIGSDVVHSGPFSLTRTLQALQQRSTFSIEPIPIVNHCAIALGVSNMAMLLVLQSVNEFARLALDSELEALKADIESAHHALENPGDDLDAPTE